MSKLGVRISHGNVRSKELRTEIVVLRGDLKAQRILLADCCVVCVLSRKV
jgi:hypothetical protein